MKVSLTIVRPAGSKAILPAFIFVHGGGWVLGDFPTHERFVRDLVADSGFTAIFVNYTPSPEAHYPTAINEIHAAARWVAENSATIRVDGKRLAIVGNSVGGNMTAAVALMAKDNGGPEFKCQIMLQATLEELKGLPPALIQVAGNDVLRDEGVAYARQLDAAGVDVTSVRYENLIHDYGLLNAISQVPAVRDALHQAAEMLRKHLK